MMGLAAIELYYYRTIRLKEVYIEPSTKLLCNIFYYSDNTFIIPIN